MAIGRRNITIRFSIIIIIAFLICAAIFYCAFESAVIEREGWQKKISRLKIEDKTIDPQRGNIFASDGRLMASSIWWLWLH